jgi:hypothetical protein
MLQRDVADAGKEWLDTFTLGASRLKRGEGMKLGFNMIFIVLCAFIMGGCRGDPDLNIYPPRTWQQQEDPQVRESMRQAEEERGWALVKPI